MEPQKNNSTKILVAVVLLLILLLGGLAYYIMAGGSDTNNNNTPTPTPTVTSSPSPTVSPTTFSTATPTPTPTSVATVTSTPTPTTAGPTDTPAPTLAAAVKVKVFYSVDPDSNNDPTYAEYRTKNTKRSDMATFALEQTIAGPSATEAAAGLFTPIKLSGDSNCGKDFTISVDSATKKATVKFCKTIDTGGVGDDGRIKTVVNADLKQFTDTITSVAILTKDDNCFGDLSGQNACKN